ncbi:ABC-type uncharacterized transport system, auxiliary component [Kingella potus]|uniref:ABC-type uncharacterized transport system, auxiliary component n=1 Tax=Kingella potus TaxID=265175 RepID=A0A377R2K8_9NEIS|nr:ABC-type transport auxiliary lipoprotein family protein [Kingella potus]UOO99874.1 ABC-type transport auxiliary lipoprotein family protein [Kingella potus]STR03130.1 ABC-type uncharacterized transport system, auxiliary component [Kingella potus]
MNKVLLSAAFLALAACASQPVSYFTLPDSRFQMPEHTQGKSEIAVRVVLAAPLDKGGLTYQTDALQLNHARSHLWAQPLEQAAAARFANEFNRAGSARHYFVPSHQSSAAQSLTVYLEAFQGTYRGSTLVEGYVRRADGSRRFRAETPQQGDGYEAMLQSLSQGLSSAAEQVSGK